MRFAIPACLALAALSLLLPSELSYDPWAWVVWGREIVEWDLDTTGGPSWKPGPVLFTTPFALLEGVDEDLPPALWLVVARAGSLLALVMAFRVAARLGGGGRSGTLVGGTAAVLAVATLPFWIRYSAHGNEAPLAVALLLWAILEHLDERRGRATLLLFGACLLRPEVFPLLALEAVLFWHAHPRRWRAAAGIAGGLLALAVLWLVPEWIGAGNPLDGGKQAASEPRRSLSLEAVPWRAALERAHELGGIEIEIAALVALVVAAFRRDRATLLLGAIGVGWLLLILGMTEFGFSGARRYFLPPLVIAAVLAGVAVAYLANAHVAVAALLVVLAVPLAIGRSDEVGTEMDNVETLVQNHDRVRARLDHPPPRKKRRGLPSSFITFAAWERHISMAEAKETLGRPPGKPPAKGL